MGSAFVHNLLIHSIRLHSIRCPCRPFSGQAMHWIGYPLDRAYPDLSSAGHQAYGSPSNRFQFRRVERIPKCGIIYRAVSIKTVRCHFELSDIVCKLFCKAEKNRTHTGSQHSHIEWPHFGRQIFMADRHTEAVIVVAIRGRFDSGYDSQVTSRNPVVWPSTAWHAACRAACCRASSISSLGIIEERGIEWEIKRARPHLIYWLNCSREFLIRLSVWFRSK